MRARVIILKPEIIFSATISRPFLVAKKTKAKAFKTPKTIP